MERVIIDVTTGHDCVPGSLRDAIQKANSNKNKLTLIHIKACFKENILLTEGELNVQSNIKIVNQSNRNITITAKKPNNRIFNVGSSVKSMEITGSKKYTVILCDGKSTTNGGAINISSPTSLLTLKHVVVCGNSAKKFGGGIYTQGSVMLVSSKIDCNQAELQGGGIWSGQQITAIKSSVDKNKILVPDASSGGGGVFIDNGNVILNQSSVSGNNVAYDLILKKGGSGGGMIVMAGSIYIQNNSHVDENMAYNAGGVQQGIGNVYLSNKSTCNKNESFNSSIAAGGGGVTITMGTVFLSNSEICDNITKGMYSGGIVSLVGDVSLSNHSLIMRNVNRGPGGGIAVNVGTVTVDSNSHVSENTGASLGGGIVCFTPAPAHISITNNSHVSKNILTNAQTIRQTIDAFIRVVTKHLADQTAQAKLSGGAGSKTFTDNVPIILSQLSIIDKKLKNLPINNIGVGENIAGGAIASLLNGQINVDHSFVDENFSGKTVDKKNTPFNAFGGSIFGFLSKVNVQHSSICGNTSLSSGGGLWVSSGLNMSDSKVSKNKIISKGNGGGIFNTGNETCTLIDNIISENVASGDGGGIFSTNPFIDYNNKIIHNEPNNIVLL